MAQGQLELMENNQLQGNPQLRQEQRLPAGGLGGTAGVATVGGIAAGSCSAVEMFRVPASYQGFPIKLYTKQEKK